MVFPWIFACVTVRYGPGPQASEGLTGRAAERVSFILLAAGAGCWLGAHLELSTGAHAAWASCRMMAGFQN